MAKSLKKGDTVSWTSSGGASTGKVEKKLTKTAKVKSHVAKPTKDNPEYLVKSNKSGKEAIHKASALKKKSSK